MRATRIGLAVRQFWCGLRGHAEPQLQLRRASVGVGCAACGHRGPDVEEGRDPRPLPRPVFPPADPPALPADARRRSAAHMGFFLTTNGPEVHIGGLPGLIGTTRVPLTVEQLVGLSVSAYLCAVDASGEGYAGIGARCLSERSGVPLAIARQLADDVFGRMVLHHTAPVSRRTF